MPTPNVHAAKIQTEIENLEKESARKKALLEKYTAEYKEYIQALENLYSEQDKLYYEQTTDLNRQRKKSLPNAIKEIDKQSNKMVHYRLDLRNDLEEIGKKLKDLKASIEAPHQESHRQQTEIEKLKEESTEIQTSIDKVSADWKKIYDHNRNGFAITPEMRAQSKSLSDNLQSLRLDLKRVKTELREKEQEQSLQLDNQKTREQQLQYEKDKKPQLLDGYRRDLIHDHHDNRLTEYASLTDDALKERYNSVYEEHSTYTENPLPNYFTNRSYWSRARSFARYTMSDADKLKVIEQIILMEDFIIYAKGQQRGTKRGGKSKSKRIIKSKSKHRIKKGKGKGKGKGKKTHLHSSTRRRSTRRH